MKITSIFLFCILSCFIACNKQELEPSPKSIVSFSIEGLNNAQINILENKKIIELQVPFGTNLYNLKPNLIISAGATIVPLSGVVRDFTKEVFYTLTGADGSKVIYQVKVIIGAEPLAEILSVSKDTVEASQSLILKVKNLSRFPTDVKTSLLAADNQVLSVSNKLLDSVSVELDIPANTPAQYYKIQLSNKNKIILSSKLILVQYPSPQAKVLFPANILQGDTVQLKGSFILPSKYQYELILTQNKMKTILPVFKTMVDIIQFVVPNGFNIGNYEVQLRNKTEQKLSKESIKLAVYDKEKPFVRALKNKQPAYKPTQEIIWNVVNFDKVSARFFQVQLQGNSQIFAVNGIYDNTQKIFKITLPNSIKSGSYTAIINFIDATGKNIYEININDLIKI